MPCKRTVFNWLGQHEEFEKLYRLALQTRADTQAEEIIEISDDKGIDANDKRVRIDARKWLMGKMNAPKYGDKSSVEVSGRDGAPLPVAIFQLPDNGRGDRTDG